MPFQSIKKAMAKKSALLEQIKTMVAAGDRQGLQALITTIQPGYKTILANANLSLAFLQVQQGPALCSTIITRFLTTTADSVIHAPSFHLSAFILPSLQGCREHGPRAVLRRGDSGSDNSNKLSRIPCHNCFKIPGFVGIHQYA